MLDISLFLGHNPYGAVVTAQLLQVVPTFSLRFRMSARQVQVRAFMNALVADLQTQAWSSGVKLVADVSSNLVLSCDEDSLTKGLTLLLFSLLRTAVNGSTVTIITALERHGHDGSGTLRIHCAASAPPGVVLVPRLQEARVLLAQLGGQITQGYGEQVLTLDVSIPGASSETSETKTTYRTALVVDDDHDTQELLRALLEEFGFRVVSVSDGLSALLELERHSVDLVVTDILMPNMNGIDLLRRIKDVRPELPVILFSGYRDELMQNLVQFPDRILTKPLTRSDLLMVVRSIFVDA